MINRTKEEIKNINLFIINISIFITCLMLFLIGAMEQWIIPFTIGLCGVMCSFLYMFYVGYNHGWELKRISMIEE